MQQSAVPKDNSSDTTWEGGITVLLGNKVSICWFCFWGWTLAKRKLHKALVCLALFETCFSECGTRDRYPFLLSLVKHISKAEKYLGKPLDKTFQVWDQVFFLTSRSFCASLWRFVCYLFWQRLEIGVEDQFQRFPNLSFVVTFVTFFIWSFRFSSLLRSTTELDSSVFVGIARPEHNTLLWTPGCRWRHEATDFWRRKHLGFYTLFVFVWTVSRFRRSLSWLKLQTAATRRTKMHRKERMWSVWFVHVWSFWFPRTGTRELIVFKMLLMCSGIFQSFLKDSFEHVESNRSQLAQLEQSLK